MVWSTTRLSFQFRRLRGGEAAGTTPANPCSTSTIRSLSILLRSLTSEFDRQMLRLQRPYPTVQVALDKQLLQLPANGAEEQWIAEIEEYLRGDNSLKPPFAEVPKQLGPLG